MIGQVQGNKMARILLVEDEDAVRDFVARALEMDRHEVVKADNGEDGLARLEAQGGEIDLLLSDIQMPAMDGIALAEAAKRRLPALPILLMTGYAEQRERAESLQSIVRDVIQKPFTLAQIRSLVNAAIAA